MIKTGLTGFRISEKVRLYIQNLMPDAHQKNIDGIILELESRELSVEMGHAKLIAFNENINGKWTGKKIYALHITLPGLRLIAERTGKYGGWKGPSFWDHTIKSWVDFWSHDVPPQHARAGIIRKDWVEPCFFTARLSSYKPKPKKGNEDFQWRDRPEIMLGKCAMSGALQAAFPQECRGIITPYEEIKTTEVPKNPPPETQENKKITYESNMSATDIETQSVKMVCAFYKLGIEVQEIEGFCGKGLSTFGQSEIAMLREAYSKIKSGLTFADLLAPDDDKDGPIDPEEKEFAENLVKSSSGQK